MKFARDLQDRLFRVGPLVIPRNTVKGSNLCLEYDPTEGGFQRHSKHGPHVISPKRSLLRLRTSALHFLPRMG
jgi:hypothetical protein